MTSKPILFSGSVHPALAQEISALVGMPLGKVDLHRFPDGETAVQVQESVRGRTVYVLQSLAFDPNNALMELLILLDALRRGGATSITVILPYFGYARQNRLDKPGVGIAAKLVANMLTSAGTDHLITMDLHSEQIVGFFDIPVAHLLSRAVLIPTCAKLKLDNVVVMAPDKGGIKLASSFAKQLGVSLALIDKERLNAYSVETNIFVGDVKGKTVLLTDDMCSTAGTLIHAAEAAAQQGAKRILAIVAHGLFTGQALENITKSPIELVITTNSVPPKEAMLKHPKIKIVSIASLFAQEIAAT